MELSVHEAARLLNVPEHQIRSWVQRSDLPHYSVHDEVLFNRDEILEWAAKHRVPIRLPDPGPGSRSPGETLLGEALARGGIFHDLPGQTLAEVFREVLVRLPLPAGTDLDLMVQMMAARERAGSTGLGDGIAIPHMQRPVIVPLLQPMVGLAFLRQPIDWKAADGKPVFCLFLLITPTVHDHVTLLARIANSLQDPGCREWLRGRAAAPDLQAAFRALEEKPGGRVEER